MFRDKIKTAKTTIIIVIIIITIVIINISSEVKWQLKVLLPSSLNAPPTSGPTRIRFLPLLACCCHWNLRPLTLSALLSPTPQLRLPTASGSRDGQDFFRICDMSQNVAKCFQIWEKKIAIHRTKRSLTWQSDSEMYFSDGSLKDTPVALQRPLWVEVQKVLFSASQTVLIMREKH